MTTDHKFEKLIYLDAGFISSLYEDEKGISTKTTITRSQTLDASASVAFFSGGGSTTESRSYEISSTKMIEELTRCLDEYPSFDPASFSFGSPSAYFWTDGVLTINKVKVTRTRDSVVLAGPPTSGQQPSSETVGEEAYFCIKKGEVKIALSPNDQYFVSGVAALKGMAHIVIQRMRLPCKALVRVYSAQTNAEEWLATPLIIYDADC